MQIRTIAPSEVDRFAAAFPHSLGAAGLAAHIRELWENGSSKPEWCFVIDSDGQFLGRIVYRGASEEVSFTALYLPWDGDYLPLGKRLFHESLSILQTQGITRLEAFVPSTWGFDPQARALMESIGLPLVQEKVRYTWNEGHALIEPPHQLVYRSLAEVGQAAFIDAIRRVTGGSLDRLDLLQVASLGADRLAREYFRLLKEEFAFHPDWWWLAYTPSGELVGQVVGVPFNVPRQEGSIGYIGVVPEQRGHGYIHDLLARGMQAMFADRLKAFVCDTDALNAPMQNAFEKQGYVQTGAVWVYHGDLTELTL
jgi:ribosomal protein S18 acetylase RimI-like enzyme